MYMSGQSVCLCDGKGACRRTHHRAYFPVSVLINGVDKYTLDSRGYFLAMKRATKERVTPLHDLLFCRSFHSKKITSGIQGRTNIKLSIF